MSRSSCPGSGGCLDHLRQGSQIAGLEGRYLGVQVRQLWLNALHFLIDESRYSRGLLFPDFQVLLKVQGSQGIGHLLDHVGLTAFVCNAEGDGGAICRCARSATSALIVSNLMSLRIFSIICSMVQLLRRSA